MKQKMSIAGILLLAALGMQANNYTVKSPDGKLVVNVACEGGKASYTVDYNGKQMLGTSALGLVANYGDFSKDLTMGILKGGEVKPLSYKMTRIKKPLTFCDRWEQKISALMVERGVLGFPKHNLAPSQNTLVGTTAFQLSTPKVADLNSHNLRQASKSSS